MSIKTRKTLLLCIIYLAFVSLGLPDGLLGVAWPSMRASLGLPLEAVSILTAILFTASCLSSVCSAGILERIGTGAVTLVSGLLTAGGLMGYALSGSFSWLLICTLPLGIGQGAVDSGLNRYVAENYSSRHMNWLHCFWGVGASAGPLLMTLALRGGSWRGGYTTVSVLQFLLSGILLVSLLGRLWVQDKKPPVLVHKDSKITEKARGKNYRAGLLAPGIAVLLFFLYSGTEFTVSVWLTSLLVEGRHFAPTLAGTASSVYFFCIMAGRFLSGVVVDRIGNARMIRLGLCLSGMGAVLAAAAQSFPAALTGVILIGLGFAPVYPCRMHDTPARFPKEVSDKLIGFQVGAACLGGTVVSAAVGLVLSHVSLEALFWLVAGLILLQFVLGELLYRSAGGQVGIIRHEV